MKISIITVVYNNEDTIQDAMNSVLSQEYDDLEYIIIDGASTDGIVNVIKDTIKKYPEKDIKFISEKDEGMYDAINKGIKIASGDIVGILHSDDFYADKTAIARVMDNFKKTGVDCVFADLMVVDKENVQKKVRYYKSNGFTLKWFSWGNMPAHPTVFLKRELYNRFGFFKTDYKISADFELLTRFFIKGKISYHYMPEVIVYMRRGGRSSNGLQAIYVINKEIVRACRENGVKTNVVKVYSKYFTKIFQLVLRMKKTTITSYR